MEARENIVAQASETVANALIPQKNDKQKWWQQVTEYSLIVIFIVMFVTMSLTVDHFFSIENMLGLALSISQIGMVACTMMFCLASRDFDLSVGSTIAFAGVLCAMVLNATNNTFIAIIAAVAAGAVIGFVNGAVIAYLRINALITTLATMEVVRGLGFIVSHGQVV
jgi:L-arabinose transport system permease protein